VLATCGVRKLLDFVFTQRELFWLDDILPGAKLPPAVSSNANGGAALTSTVDQDVNNYTGTRLLVHTASSNATGSGTRARFTTGGGGGDIHEDDDEYDTN
jgi:hypothetical protein